MKDDAFKENEEHGLDENDVKPKSEDEVTGIDDAANEPEAEAAEEVEEDLDKLLDNTRRERDEYLELAQRTKADFENYRKRVTQDIAGSLNRGRGEIVKDLLPVLDNLERALEVSQPPNEDGSEDHLSKGVRLVREELSNVVKRAGVESFEPDGEQFDPNLHEAVMTKPQDGVKTGTVVEVVQKGYRNSERIVRPAKVVVAE